MLGNSWIAVQQAASQEGLISLKSVLVLLLGILAVKEIFSQVSLPLAVCHWRSHNNSCCWHKSWAKIPVMQIAVHMTTAWRTGRGGGRRERKKMQTSLLHRPIRIWMWNNREVTHVSSHTPLSSGVPLPADNRHAFTHSLTVPRYELRRFQITHKTFKFKAGRRLGED
jgi:hypothetical protein